MFDIILCVSILDVIHLLSSLGQFLDFFIEVFVFVRWALVNNDIFRESCHEFLQFFGNAVDVEINKGGCEFRHYDGGGDGSDGFWMCFYGMVLNRDNWI